VTSPPTFREELLAVSPGSRDAWVDRRFGLAGLPDDDPALPMGCVPYLPSPVDVVLRTVAAADVRESDVFVDIGMGAGRTAALVQLLTGAAVVGVEIQPALAEAAGALFARLELPHLRCVVGDAPALTEHFATGTVFFLYCPFGGERLTQVLTALEAIAATRPIRVCCVDLPLPPCPWLVHDAPPDGAGDLVVYRSVGAASERRHTEA
jgi:SAM-dependent methyltransferase